MSVRFNVKVDAAALIKRARELTATLRDVQRPTREIALRLIDRGRESLQGRPPGKFQPQVRTGLLARSLYARPTTATGIVVASQFPYARIQQQGGIVLPTGKYLAIPMTAALKRAGTWPRDWPRGALQVARIEGRLYLIEPPKRLESLKAKVEKAELNLGKEIEARRKRHVTGKTKLAAQVSIGNLKTKLKQVKRKEARAKVQEVTLAAARYMLVRKVMIPTQPYIVWDAEMKQTTKDVWSRYLKGTPVG